MISVRRAYLNITVQISVVPHESQQRVSETLIRCEQLPKEGSLDKLYVYLKSLLLSKTNISSLNIVHFPSSRL